MFGRKVGLVVMLALGFALPIAAQQPPAPAGGAPDHVAAIKASLQQSAAALRQYQWVETTVVSVKGEEKARTENSCYYGADGKLQKTPVGAPAAEGKSPRGVRGKIVENKKEDMSESMQEAIALVKQYVPPDPERIQAAKDAGRLSLTPPDSSGTVKVTIKDYLKAGDSLMLALNAAADRIEGVTVATFTDKAKDAVGLDVDFGTFVDGKTVYASAIKLDVAAQNLAVAIENSGYKKLGG